MQFNRKPLFTHPQEVEEAFYQALASKDIKAFMSTWADEEEVLCILPSGERLCGHHPIKDFWVNTFQQQKSPIQASITVQQRTNGVMMALHHVIEDISFQEGDKTNRNLIYTTNLYMRTPDGWRLFMRQGTPVHPQQIESVTTISSDLPHTITPTSQTLH